ncbi:MAG: hypothetical protein PQJ44_01495 [Sphaerochaetaceae bacterium]|nr:hypothetical protein [Sphaerochaetaceae bacterium]
MNRPFKKKLFSEPLATLLRPKVSSIEAEIRNQSDEYFGQVPNEEYASHLESKYFIDDFPTIVWEETEIDVGETEVRGSDLPAEFMVFDKSKTFTRKLIKYEIPIKGYSDLLNYRRSNVITSQVIYGTPTILENKLILELVDLHNDPNKIEAAFEKSKNTITQKLADTKLEIDEFNNGLINHINNKIRERVQKIQNTNEYKSKFKYPIKKKNVPQTFKSPEVVKKRKIKPKPTYINQEKTNQVSISDSDFTFLLNRLQECGSNWEQHPEIYKDRDEEALRDQLIFALVPVIDGVVAGEAYNKKGKTDISIKYESTNLFIGECKIWKGPKVLTSTIDQILSYLTWRDSKAAIMMFVPNKDISSVVASAKETIKNHPNFIRTLDEINEGWSNYRFHLENDKGTFLTIAIHLYHMPEL